jgi:hypothetical protein
MPLLLVTTPKYHCQKPESFSFTRKALGLLGA